jgi:hypothetical protein
MLPARSTGGRHELHPPYHGHAGRARRRRTGVQPSRAPRSRRATTTQPGRNQSRAPPAIHTVVIGGTPGWQIALIAAGAALLTAALAVTADRMRAARRRVTRHAT